MLQCVPEALWSFAEFPDAASFYAAEAICKDKVAKACKLQDMLQKQEEQAAVVQKEIESGHWDEDGKQIKDTAEVSNCAWI